MVLRLVAVSHSLHVNNPGFWLFKEYFNLTIGEPSSHGQCWKPLSLSAVW
ncbi:hypothetical protein ACNKHK_22035 [Shigella flexneri]